jgi:DNA-binding transcriptional ArsR family regulator
MSLYNRDRRAEEILGSKGRIRVLEVLTESGELNISEISRRTGLNYTSVERHLTKLEKLGLLKEKRYGKIRIFEAVFKSFTVSFDRGRPIRIDIENRTDKVQ